MFQDADSLLDFFGAFCFGVGQELLGSMRSW
jgi:hypothetical protein